MLIIVAIVLLILFVSLSAIAGETRPLLYAVIILTVCNDIIFIPLGEAGNSPLALIAKSWREEFIVAGFVSYLLWMGRGRPGVQMNANTGLIIAVLAAVAALGVLIGTRENSFFAVFTVSRSYALPVLLPISLYVSGAFSRDKHNLAYWLLLVLGACMAAYSAYTIMKFSGVPTDIWYYDFVAGQKISNRTEQRLIIYQFIRDGHLRATGFLISAVDYSILSGILSVFALAGALYFKRPVKRILALVMLATCIPAIEMSQTRAGYGVLALAIIAGFSFRYLRVRWAYAYPLVLIALVAATLIAVQISPGSFDSSIGGRPRQFFDAVASFRPFGWGFGRLENNGPTYKDSLYLSSIGTFGALAIFYIGVLLLIYRAGAIVLRNAPRRSDAQAYAIGSFAAFSAMWYIFGFHYTLGNVGFYALLLMAYASFAQGELANTSGDGDVAAASSPTKRIRK